MEQKGTHAGALPGRRLKKPLSIAPGVYHRIMEIRAATISALMANLVLRLQARRIRAVILFAVSASLALPCRAAQHPKASSRPHTLTAAQSDFMAANKLLNQGQIPQALEKVQEGLKSDPRSVAGLNLLGIILDQQGKPADAVAAFQAALKIEPQSVLTHNNLGNSYFFQHKLDEAREQFRISLRLDPGNRDANYNLASVDLASGQTSTAVTRLLAIHPASPDVLFKLTEAYFQLHQTQKALKTAEQLSAQAQNDLRLHFSLGVLMAAQKQYSFAVREFEKANALQPGTYEVLHNLGQAYLHEQSYAKAELALDQALRLRPDSPSTLYLQAQAYSRQNKTLQAVRLLLKARKLAPNNTDIIFLMGRISMKQSYFEDAIRILEQGVKIDPKRPDLHAALGESYFSAGNVAKAIQEFKTLISLDPSAPSYAFMGLCYRHLGKFDEAKTYFLEGLKQSPNNTECLYNMGYISNKQGNYADAERYLTATLKISPDYEQALYELASVRMEQKNFKAAIPMLNRCVQLKPNDSEAYYKLATAERSLHLVAQAQRDYKIFATLSKNPKPGPAPYQHFFESLGQRQQLNAVEQNELDLTELLQQVKAHPDQPRGLYLLAETYLKLGKKPQALDAVKQLDQLSGGDARTLLGVGVLLAQYRLYPEAIQHFQLVLKADPTSGDARYNLANAFFQSGQYAQALDQLKQVPAAGQKDDAYLALLGDTYAHLGDEASAASIFSDAIGRAPDNDQYYLSLALVQLRAGDLAAADKTLRQGLARIPDSGKIVWGLGVLAAVDGNNQAAEKNLQRSVDLLPQWQSSYSALGTFYFETGQILKARETLGRYSQLFPHGGMDVSRIEQVLASTPAATTANPSPLSPQARQQFLALALMLADQTP
jgi:tetratricopeptide (TPR) repeat protein